jgi:hypothetical protein
MISIVEAEADDLAGACDRREAFDLRKLYRRAASQDRRDVLWGVEPPALDQLLQGPRKIRIAFQETRKPISVEDRDAGPAMSLE